jgi:hypothetical protein
MSPICAAEAGASVAEGEETIGKFDGEVHEKDEMLKSESWNWKKEDDLMYYMCFWEWGCLSTDRTNGTNGTYGSNGIGRGSAGGGGAVFGDVSEVYRRSDRRRRRACGLAAFEFSKPVVRFARLKVLYHE